MSDIRIEKFKVRHILEATLRKADLETVKHWGFEYFTDRLRAVENSENAAFYSVFVDDELLVVGGMVILWPGVGDCWCIGTDLVEKYPIIFFKVIKHIQNELIEHYNLHRIQAQCWEGHTQSLKWLERMGLSVEGFMRAFAPNGENYYQLSRLI